MNRDQLRQLALAGSCAGFVAVPNLGALIGGGEKTDRYDTVITPPGYAFTIWGPIFAACAADTALRYRGQGTTQTIDSATTWPLSAAYAVNTAWSLAAQTDRFQLTPALLPTATALTAVAFRRLQRPTSAPAPVTAAATGLLLGWTSLASTVNIAADAVRRGADPHSRRTIATCTVGLAVTSAALATVVAAARQGSAAVAAAAAWGLGTIAADRSRPGTIRLAAGGSTAALAGALVTSVRRHQ